MTQTEDAPARMHRLGVDLNRCANPACECGYDPRNIRTTPGHESDREVAIWDSCALPIAPDVAVAIRAMICRVAEEVALRAWPLLRAGFESPGDVVLVEVRLNRVSEEPP